MSTDRLICPKCQCPLTPPSSQATQVSCPRCTTWLDIDPSCGGSCFKCHKVTEAQATPSSPCVETSLAASGTGCDKTAHAASEKSLQNVVQSERWACAPDPKQSWSFVRAWKALLGKKGFR